MVKEWTCTECSNIHTKSMVNSIREGGPEECENCGNDEFDEIVIGGIHRFVDGVT